MKTSTSMLGISMLAAAFALSSGAASAQEKLKIGLITTLSGPPAALGQQQRNGFTLALKALGNKLERVVLGDDRVLERPKRPAAVVIKRDDLVELSILELHRLLDEQRTSHRAMVVDSELHDGAGG